MKTTWLFLLLAVSLNQNSVDKLYLLGKFDPSADSRFVKLTAQYAQGSALNGYLRKETFEAFKKMAVAAQKDSVPLIIISATRNFDSQKKIWENKWNGKKKVDGVNLTTVSDLKERCRLIMLYSSMPGTSRHHWGTDMDLNSLENNYFQSGVGLKVYQWLTAHAADYGFCQPYTNKAGGRSGYEEEKWHWSYTPLSKAFLKEYVKQVTYADIHGFDGSEQAEAIGSIESYVKGVACP
ncbi:MAG: M15 family metallopeptidase [Bacteroidetes bacterium]|nr:M15 family metallopeptidase [Bacteroidota bacterium]MBS1540461.1 M15 family metallopeptidase [Bacteroidota bacterium]